jgi:hypothetical protein
MLYMYQLLRWRIPVPCWSDNEMVCTVVQLLDNPFRTTQLYIYQLRATSYSSSIIICSNVLTELDPKPFDTTSNLKVCVLLVLTYGLLCIFQSIALKQGLQQSVIVFSSPL